MMRHVIFTAARRLKCRRIFLCLIIFCVAFSTRSPGLAEETQDGMIRVKLTRLGSRSAITFDANCDYYVQNGSSLRIPAGSRVTVSASGSTLYLSVSGSAYAMGSSLKLLRGTPGQTGIRFTDPVMSNLFCGDLYLTASSSILSAILNIYIEDYLYGVVGYVMSPSYPLEALKCQAIAARSCALWEKQANLTRNYDLTDNAACLIYKGLSGSPEYENVIRAVNETSGDVLTYAGTPARCYSCLSNGGQTESARNAWGEDLPYSVVQSDSYDLAGSGTSQSIELRKDAQNLPDLLKRALIDGVVRFLAAHGITTEASSVQLHAITGIQAVNPRFADPSLLYQTLCFNVRTTATDMYGRTQTGEATVEIPVYGGLESWCNLSLNAQNNETVWVQENSATFTITLRRQGHGVGLSQRGAQVMARDHGMRCPQILEYYYPGTTLVSLMLTNATTNQQSESNQPIADGKVRTTTCIYSSASGDSRRLVELETGSPVSIYAVSGSWAAVGFNDIKGFLRTEDLSEYQLCEETTIHPDTPLYASVSAETGAALRELPADKAVQLAHLPTDASVVVYSYTENWANVLTSDGNMGYIARSALQITSAISSGTTASPTIVSDGTLHARTRESTPLYGEPGSSNERIATLSGGESLVVLAYNAEWARVRTGTGLEGYVPLSRLLSQTEASANEADSITMVEGIQYVYVCATHATIYAGTSKDSGALTTALSGTRLQLGAYNAAWACVRHGDLIGFIRRDALAGQPPVHSEIVHAEFSATLKNDAPVYAAPDVSQQPLTRLSAGQSITVYAYNDALAYIGIGDHRGFITLENLEVIR